MSKFKEGDIVTCTIAANTEVRDLTFVSYYDAETANVIYKGNNHMMHTSRMKLQEPLLELRRVFEEEVGYV